MATVEHESVDEVTWKGVHISQLQTSLNHYQYPRLIRDEKHTILVKVPVIQGQIPECFPSILNKKDYWDQNHVKLPCSEKNITKEQINRWHLMQRALSSSILSSHQLEAAILSYNKRYANEWNFTAIHSFFEEILTESETNTFFSSLLPKIVRLALCLPELITSGVPLLKRGRTHSISLSQLQISCLLSNAFLCAFPHRNTTKKNSQYVDYPDINFNRLFQCKDLRRTERIHEKLKCIFNYFRRVTTVVPSGIVTYSRQFVPNNLLPQWSKSNKKLSRLYVSSSGTIEDDGFGLFQVDFANKYVGGGVLATGYVQEEIRFVICPELIISRLFTECLGENEALVVTGCERFNKYKGYGHTFEWDGDFVDGTPSDEDGRKYCTLIAVDALNYERNPAEQYSLQNWLRDINKAYVGYSWGSNRKREELCAVATGNWGCGVYKGNAQLKSLLQVMAVAEIGRDLAYFTFGDEQLRDTIASMHQFLVQNEVTIGKIYHLLELYSHERMYTTTELFDYLKDKISNNSESSAVSKQDSQEFGTFSSKMINTFCSATTTGTSIKPPFCYRMKTDDSADSRRKSLQKCVADDEYEKSNDLRSAEIRAISNFYTLPDKGETSHSSSDKQNSKSCNFFVERSAADSCSFDILEKFKMSMQYKKKKVDIQPADNLSSLVTSEDNDVCNSDSKNVASNNISNATNEYSVFTDSNVLDQWRINPT